jgi:hypothetical protein
MHTYIRFTYIHIRVFYYMNISIYIHTPQVNLYAYIHISKCIRISIPKHAFLNLYMHMYPDTYKFV